MNDLYKNNKITKLLNIERPIIQGGMVWVSGAKLAAASANAGCLGLIGAGSMKPELLKSQIQKAKSLTDNFHAVGVNIPLLYKYTDEQINVALSEGIKVFFTSAGSPKKYTSYLKEHGATVVHVCASPKLAKKCEDAGVDAIVCEGFEAGGHNGIDEITTMCLIPQVKKVVNIPIIAAGGIASGGSMAAAFCLGADGIQMGTRFLMTKESSAHEKFKNYILEASSGDTKLMMKKTVPVRLLRNHFADEIERLEKTNASAEELINYLGKGRAKAGMLDGDLEEGELEVGQICSLIDSVPSTKEMIEKLESEYISAIKIFKTDIH